MITCSESEEPERGSASGAPALPASQYKYRPVAVGPPPRFRFTDEAEERGLTAINHCGDPVHKRFLLETMGSGAAFLDYDLDDDLDLFVADGCTLAPPRAGSSSKDWQPAMDGQCRLYRNDGKGHFSDVTKETGATFTGFAMGASAADYDNDGDPDLFVTCWGPDCLFRNDGNGKFTEVSKQVGATDSCWSVASCWFDCENDGDLDLYVSNYFSMTVEVDPDCWNKVDCPYFDMLAACGPKGMLPEPDSFFLNLGNGTFREASEERGFRSIDARFGLGVVAFDHDRDGDVDVFVANDSRPNYLFDNDGSGQFEEIGALAGCAMNRSGIAQAGMGVGCGDWDGDLDLDLFLTNFSHDDNTLYRNDGGGLFLDITTELGFGEDVYYSLGWGTDFVDFDNDGALELFVANGHIYPEADQRAPELTYRQWNRVYVREDGRMRDVTAQCGPGMEKLSSTRGAAFGDVDNDGDIDAVLVEMNERPTLLINQLSGDGGLGHYLLLSLEGTRCNRAAIGAQVLAQVGGRTIYRVARSGHSYACGSDPRIHLGTGGALRLEELRILWPGGDETVLKDVGVDRWIHVKQGSDAPEVKLP